MLHPFISSPYASGHVITPVLAFSTSLHAVLLYAAVTTTGVVRHAHPPAMAREAVHFTELAVKRVASRAVRPLRRLAHAPLFGVDASSSERTLPAQPISLDLSLPDLPVLPDFEPDVSVTEFDGPTGIADDVLHLGFGRRGSRSVSAARYSAFDEAGVERQARPAPENRLPRYPYQMLSRGIQTQFEVTFVVDTSGVIDQGTVEWPLAVERDFRRAVADVMSKWRFVPAQIGGRRVRQMVSQPFQFRLDSRPGY
jgi:TonB family protein